ncbi:ArsR family transcriptional regulator [Gluconacetobacter johannae DSM 13595]|uniref:Winged helix-turn-helix transcriptional regulator n=1 Tax=Gluconacetobacter johannae TaxID=112140 RepID=A0A7W4J7P3_9PROT|nr:metalloregulator ArsR/SmtB family transcription factor [Gluconacetobacter johannae]MBB2176197.1 winged helix-turn-helix transcriptional regulator [Gluconacetobacter johannae]GBQ89201.1 ArsR family transcriptional regulator [Gluconacetobacter johannae DSM 13595]
MTAAPLDRAAAEDTAERLRALAQPQRLMILALLLAGEHAVGEIDARTGIGQPALSQQLAELRRGGLVAMRRAARQVLYRMADPDAALRVRAVLALFGPDAHPARALAAQSLAALAAPADTPAPAAIAPAAGTGSAARFVRIVGARDQVT